MNQPAYPAARFVAGKVFPHFSRHQESKDIDPARLAALPDLETIEAIVDAAFWASLRREEGYPPRISLAFVCPQQADEPLLFERPLQLNSASLTKLAPAVERPGIHLGVWHQEGELTVWGATRNLPAYCFVIEVIVPGLLVIKHSRGEDCGKFVNVAVLQGDQVKLINQECSGVPGRPALLTSLLGLDAQFLLADSLNVPIQLAISMRAHGRGGSLLVVPTGSLTWRESILQPITYSVSPAFSALGRLLQASPAERSSRKWRDTFNRAIDGIAGLTAVDGATIITDSFELLAFGAKIIVREGSVTVGEALITEPIENSGATIAEPAQLGGTRHLSAAQFVADQRDAVALVASQDGRFTVFGWSSSQNMVHAHRIESLLL